MPCLLLHGVITLVPVVSRFSSWSAPRPPAPGRMPVPPVTDTDD